MNLLHKWMVPMILITSLPYLEKLQINFVYFRERGVLEETGKVVENGMKIVYIWEERLTCFDLPFWMSGK